MQNEAWMNGFRAGIEYKRILLAEAMVRALTPTAEKEQT
jgi:hypothetical protein